MGADRAILITRDDKVEPLGAAKLLTKVAAEESPELIMLGKQAIDDNNQQTGRCSPRCSVVLCVSNPREKAGRGRKVQA